MLFTTEACGRSDERMSMNTVKQVTADTRALGVWTVASEVNRAMLGLWKHHRRVLVGLLWIPVATFGLLAAHEAY